MRKADTVINYLHIGLWIFLNIIFIIQTIIILFDKEEYGYIHKASSFNIDDYLKILFYQIFVIMFLSISIIVASLRLRGKNAKRMINFLYYISVIIFWLLIICLYNFYD